MAGGNRQEERSRRQDIRGKREEELPRKVVGVNKYVPGKGRVLVSASSAYPHRGRLRRRWSR